MAFDKTKPAESTKIREYPTVLTANFAGIQEGDSTFKMDALNFGERVAPLDVNPTLITDTMIVYSKTDGTETELFVMNDKGAGEITQLTQAKLIGSSTSGLSCNTLTFDKNVSSMNKIHQVSGWARVAADGSLTATSGNLSIVKEVQAGRYTLSFLVPPVTTDFVGFVTMDDPGIANVNNYTATGFRITTETIAFSPTNLPFQVVVFGGR